MSCQCTARGRLNRPHEAMSDEQTSWVRSSGWPWPFVAFAGAGSLVGCLLIYLLALPLPGTHSRPPIVDLLPYFGFYELGVWAAFTGTIWVNVPRLVGVSRQGVTFKTAIRTTDVSWQNLGYPDRMFIARLVFRLPNGRTAPFWQSASVRQARMILNHPSCPNWDVPPRVLRYLGLGPSRGPDGRFALTSGKE